MRFSIVVAIGLGGCITHDVSKLGPFVKNIQPSAQGLVVDSCVIEHDHETDYTWMWLGETSEEHDEVKEGTCWRQVVPTGDVR
jgi:hypothetical protein